MTQQFHRTTKPSYLNEPRNLDSVLSSYFASNDYSLYTILDDFIPDSPVSSDPPVYSVTDTSETVEKETMATDIFPLPRKNSSPVTHSKSMEPFEYTRPQSLPPAPRRSEQEGAQRDSTSSSRQREDTEPRSSIDDRKRERKREDDNSTETSSVNERSDSQRSVKPRKILGNYTLTKTLGAGSMGKVKLAVHNITNEKLAVKIVPRSPPNQNQAEGGKSNADKDENRETRTIREASIMLLLHHPYIVQLKEVMVLPHHYYMFLEYVNGGQLLDYIISHGKLKEKQARKFGRQIVSALDYCHRNSIVHRDLKIENILISKSGNIKIIDFGLSNLYSPASHLSTFCGSLYFAAPELLNARAYTGPEVDVWSFGIVLYVLVCGKVPFDDQSMPALHAKIKRGVVEYPNFLSSDCKHLLSRMLVTNPTSRATITEVMNHQWLSKGYDEPPKNYLPYRPPLTLPIDMEIVRGMTGFEFGSEEEIKEKLESVICSETYQKSAKILIERAEKNKEIRAEAEANSIPSKPRSLSGLGGSFKRSSMSSSSNNNSINREVSDDPQTLPGAYHPVISIYYLVKEKMERERLERVTATGGHPEFGSSDSIGLIPNMNSSPAGSRERLSAFSPHRPHHAHHESMPSNTIERPQEAHHKDEMTADAGASGRKAARASLRADEIGTDINNGLNTFGRSDRGDTRGRSEASGLNKGDPEKDTGASFGGTTSNSTGSTSNGRSSGNNIIRRLSLAIARDRSREAPLGGRKNSIGAMFANFDRNRSRERSASASTDVMPIRTFSVPATDKKAEERRGSGAQQTGWITGQKNSSNINQKVTALLARTHSRGRERRETKDIVANDRKPASELPAVDQTADKQDESATATTSQESDEKTVTEDSTEKAPPPPPKFAKLPVRTSSLRSSETSSAAHNRSMSTGAANLVRDYHAERLYAHRPTHMSGTPVQGDQPQAQTQTQTQPQKSPTEDNQYNEKRSSARNSLVGQSPLSPTPSPSQPISRPKQASTFPIAGSSPPTSQPGTADQNIRPVFLKGLFSVQTTSTKHPSVIRGDIIRVLERIGVKWREVKGALECTHSPSIDYQTVTPQQKLKPIKQSKFSENGYSLRSKESGDITSADQLIIKEKELPPLPLEDINLAPNSNSKRTHHRKASGSSVNSALTGTTLQSNATSTTAAISSVAVPDLVVRFEIFIVRVPWLPGVHGVQFRRVSGDPWMYKNMCSKILGELKL